MTAEEAQLQVNWQLQSSSGTCGSLISSLLTITIVFWGLGELNFQFTDDHNCRQLNCEFNDYQDRRQQELDFEFTNDYDPWPIPIEKSGALT